MIWAGNFCVGFSAKTPCRLISIFCGHFNLMIFIKTISFNPRLGTLNKIKLFFRLTKDWDQYLISISTTRIVSSFCVSKPNSFNNLIFMDDLVIGWSCKWLIDWWILCLVEKKSELDRLTAQYAALSKLEAEQQDFMDQFILQK